MITTESAIEAVATVDRKRSPQGCSCYFVTITPDWGVKVYHRKEERDSSHRLQQMAAVAGVAPAVGVSFDIDRSYCYLTEIAVPLLNATPEIDEKWSEWEWKISVMMPWLSREIDEVVEDVTTACKLKQRYWDTHYGNFGYLRGKLVCIDFSNYSGG